MPRIEKCKGHVCCQCGRRFRIDRPESDKCLSTIWDYCGECRASTFRKEFIDEFKDWVDKVGRENDSRQSNADPTKPIGS